MTREQINEIRVALGEGKTIQYYNHLSKHWEDCSSENMLTEDDEYRVSPKYQYRPFASMEELEKELVKHQPYGQIIEACYLDRACIVGMATDNGIKVKHYPCLLEDFCRYLSFSEAFAKFTFPDDTPFGVYVGE